MYMYIYIYIYREHQKEAATFLLAKLMGGETLNNKKTELKTSTVGNDSSGAENNSYDNEENGLSVTGAILADDMGTGKVIIILDIRQFLYGFHVE
jgi:hypothetical protein